MRDLTKSMMSWGWAMGVFGVQQMMNVVMPAQGGGNPCQYRRPKPLTTSPKQQ